MARVDSNPLSRMSTERDHRLDFCRGLAFFCIAVDHIPYSLLSRITLMNCGFCDAAEIFVLVAGITFGLTYPGGGKAGFDRIAPRIGAIYLVHIALLVLACLVVVVVRRSTGLDIAAHDDLAALGDRPLATLWSILTLQLQPEFFDILPLYLVLLIWMALIFPLARSSAPLMLAVSAAIWAFANVYQLNFRGIIDGGWYFNPLSWQLLICVGVVVGLSMRRGDHADFRNRFGTVYVGALTYLAVAFVYAAPWTGLPISWVKTVIVLPVDLLAPVSKSYESGFRILDALSLCFVFAWHVKADAAWLQQAWARRVCAIGRRPLVAFCVTTVVALLGTIFFEMCGRGLNAQIVVNTLAIAALVHLGTVDPRALRDRAWSFVRGRNSTLACAHVERLPETRSPATA
jgi:hypothetical protein